MTEVSISNPYAVLALPLNATTDDVLQTYDATVRQYHPDFLQKRDPQHMDYAKNRFISLTYARDILTDPASRRAYDESSPESSVPTMYSFAYGYVNDKSDISMSAALSAVDYEAAWSDFIAKPFGWTRQGVPALNKWINVSWLSLLGCVVAAIAIFALLGFSGPLLFAYLATTHSSPMIMSFIPLIAGFAGAGLGVIATLTVIVCVVVKHPYSAWHSTIFWLYVITDVLSSFILTLTLSLAFVGMIVGYYLF